MDYGGEKLKRRIFNGISKLLLLDQIPTINDEASKKRESDNYNSLRDELKNRKREGFGFEIVIGERVMMVVERDDLEQVVMIFVN